MAWFNRMSATVIANVERLVAPIENHDAVVDAAIAEARRAVARSKVRLAHLQRETATMKAELTRLEGETDRWRDRAKEFAVQNENAALECLKRRRNALARAGTLRGAIAAQEESITRLTRDIGDVEQRIATMNQQRHLMRTREAAADALARVADVAAPENEIARTFERWEVRITEAEVAAGRGTVPDPLETECVAREERAELLAELAALTGQEGAPS